MGFSNELLALRGTVPEQVATVPRLLRFGLRQRQ